MSPHKDNQSLEAKELLRESIKVCLSQLLSYLLDNINESVEICSEEWFEELFMQYHSVHGEGEEGDCEFMNREPYEFWVVSSDFGEFLKDRGKLVTEEWGFYLWGRECSGQSILMDSVFQDFLIECNVPHN